MRAKRGERRSQARCAYEIRRCRSEDSVIFVLAIRNQALTILHREQTMAGAKIPAARALAQIAADCSHVANLRARHAERGSVERWELTADERVERKIVKRDRGTDAHAGR